jgi:salicylate hydroxylase
VGALRPVKALIIGGGIGGITTALCLQRRDIAFELMERAPALQEIGAGIQLSANCVRILQRLGLGAQLQSIGVYPLAHQFRSWSDGAPILRTPLGETAEAAFGAPYYHAHRAELLDLLVAALGLDHVHLGHHVTAVAEANGKVTATSEQGLTVSGDVLVGADGIHSFVRQTLFGLDRPRDSGNIAWRGTLPAERLGDLKLERISGIWFGPARSFVHYFISAGRTFNWIGIGRSANYAQESWTAEGKVEDALAEFAGWHPQIQAIIRATDRLLKMALFDRDALPAWQRGRMVLLGDACHAMLPFHAQGAAQSIEDAYVLAACLDRIADPVAALAAYVRLRKDRTEWVQQFSREAEVMFQLDDEAAIERRDRRLRENQTRYAGGFPPAQLKLYGYDADQALQAVA